MLEQEQFTGSGEQRSDNKEGTRVLPLARRERAQILLASPDVPTCKRWKLGLQESPYKISEVGGATALAHRVRNLHPEVLFLDLSLPIFGKVEGITRIIQLSPQTKIVAFTRVATDTEGVALLRVGARGYCPQDLDAVLLRRVVDVVERREIWIGRRLVSCLLDEFQAVICQLQNDSTSVAGPGLAQLTPREYVVAELVRRGESNREIAQQCGIAERTVKAHVTSTFRKLGVRDRVQLAVRLTKWEEQESED